MPGMAAVCTMNDAYKIVGGDEFPVPPVQEWISDRVRKLLPWYRRLRLAVCRLVIIVVIVWPETWWPRPVECPV